ncbi:MAG: ParB/RepB/Spo0J family partition protein [Bacteroidales bacterium]|nr:ParB/RepB/Spo0J family partition protein [Bacteroidales bacterium]
MSKVKSPALGKGLEALLGSIEKNPVIKDKIQSEVDVEIANIPLNKIEPNPDQPRKEFDAATLLNLAQSIKENGVIVPITVNKQDDKYIIIAGERRYRASKLVGLKEIPAYIRIVTPTQQMQMALIENIQRDDLNAIEIALSLNALLEQTKLTKEDLGKKIGKSRASISNYVRLLSLPAEIQLAIREDKLSMGHARALINIEDEKKQLDLAHKIMDKGLSVRETEAMSNIAKEKNVEKEKKEKVLPERHNLFLTSITQRLETQVSIKRSERGKGSITINFKNDKEFERIVSLLENK